MTNAVANKDKTSSSADIDELVKHHLNNLDDKGKLQLPDDMEDEKKRIIRAEKRQRDAQAALSKTRAELEETKAIVEVLEKTAQNMLPDDFQLSEAEIKALDELKFKDPDAYRIKVNELEANAKEAQAKKLAEMTQSATEEAKNKFLANNRVTVLEEFRAANPTIQLTDEVLVNDVPPRFMNDLNAGKYDYQTYLNKVVEYLRTAKVLPGQDPGEQNNLDNLPGSTKPGKDAAEQQGKIDYAKMTF